MGMLNKEAALAAIDASDVRAGQTWVHSKTGHVYRVIAMGVAEATLSPVVVYAGRDGVVWVRGLEAFLGSNDEGQARFTRALEVEIDAAPAAAAAGVQKVVDLLNGGVA